MYNYSIMPKRLILCVDLKSFYASCSALSLGLDPLKHKLAVVGNTEREGSIVLAATPSLKALGIKQGSRLYEVPRRKDIHIVNPSMAHYIKVSNHISSILLRYVPIEDFHAYSIDEALIDVTHSLHLFAKSPAELASKIIENIRRETGISSCVGIGPNLLLAKVSLDNEAKRISSGIAYWNYDDVPTKLWPMTPLSKMWGIGPQLERKLNMMGIFSVGGLAQHPVRMLEKRFGVMGRELWKHAHGIDFSRISEQYQPQSVSIGKGQTLLRDYTNLKEIEVLILEQLEEVCFRLRNANKCCRTIQLKIGYSRQVDGGFNKAFTLESPTNLTMDLYKICVRLLAENYTGNPVRTIHVTVTNLVDEDNVQLSLFRDEEQIQREIILSKTMDTIRKKYGKNSLLRASSYLPDATGRKRNNFIGGHMG